VQQMQHVCELIMIQIATPLLHFLPGRRALVNVVAYVWI
jgi:hypothetical protein